mgnify:CR=1 FL=1
MGNKKQKENWQELADQLGLNFDEDSMTVFGNYRGFIVCLTPFEQTNQYQLIAAVSQGGQFPDAGLLKNVVKESKSLARSTVKGYRISFIIPGKMTMRKSQEKVKDALDTVTTFLIKNGYENCCELSGKIGDTDVYSVNGTYSLLSEESFLKRSTEVTEKEDKKSAKGENVVSGAVGALLGSLIGVAVIVLLGQLGYVAVLSGIVLGVCTLKEYELMGGRLSVKGILISAVIMIIMVYFGNRLDWAVSVHNYFKDDLDLFAAFRSLPELIGEGYVDGNVYHGDLAMVYIFTAAGAIPTAINLLKISRRNRMTYKLSGGH